MFDVGYSELLLIGAVALLVIGPKDLPKAMRFAGYWVGKARGVARQFRSGFDAMVREAELAEMEKKWAEENARIMREHPADEPAALPAPLSEAEAAVSPYPVPHEPGLPPSGDAPSTTDDAAEPEQGDGRPVLTEKPVVAPELPLGEPGKAAS